ncbi:uncharacterized protein LOC129769360 [Toxorhynchites rutilus septentrionalis]|uniref:uncharacterized protein LOC129769360 n=1 Tax=Toxorhynchites rutilus septentrionalis TaxID=329112 RepID=UPI0024783AF2|nr:uncharacterized protein LOC129769360 [Toxorhynchites rutilus septentrionalis]XP_055627569.1 uncharacterized protein LOC129769360 [Toxorhynchites rutilus septentrionalis]XP_055627577.1 uncharacterized protein LOC129769360 [Toxorhynchites rutilus septentrionalis]XP_055627588.1 uncharacterized protein LOC129769360 [Toxorhynchites rutilus septentrionalis]XP_055627596.1 uncharacterized protein LOC129769360 [Toxorhynchites rutilus septentrionalis]XP_055627603.1 uncharacterized protein LOC12976936
MSLQGLLLGINVIAAGASLLFGLLLTIYAPVGALSSGEHQLITNPQPDGENLPPFQSVTEATPNLAANIINLERDGGVSFIPRKDFRLQRAVPPEYAGPSAMPHCESFTMGNPDQKMLYSPGAPGNYPNNSDCVVVLEAPLGSLVRLDFRDHFHVESSDDCKYDYLEIRDGAHGFSTLIGKYCGTTYPPMITSKERFLWLHFHSDENIEYSGFVGVYEYVPRPTSSIYDDEGCRIEVSGMEGYVNRSDVPREKLQTVVEHGLSLDCMWVITVSDGWKIQLSFLLFKLERPNDCESNFVDVFTERTDLPSRLKNFCGSIADSVVSKSNVLHIRFYAEAAAINSTFSILFTAFREKAAGEVCDDDEYDCEDATCISSDLRCNGRINCRFRWDEDECQKANPTQSEHVTIIMVVFVIIFGCMVIAFVIKIVRKIMRDHKIIREHIRQSRESKLNELGRHSTKKPVDLDITKFPPPAFDKEPINVLENTANSYYREMMSPSLVGDGSGGSGGGGSGSAVSGGRGTDGSAGGIGSHMFSSSSRIDLKNDPSRNHEIQAILRSSYHEDPMRGAMALKDAGMCDMACQTRESLFQPVFKNKVTQSPNPSNIRFSTFGYETPSQQGQPSPTQLPSVVPPPPKIKHHHHHHHHHHGGGGGGTLDRSKGNKFEMQELGIADVAVGPGENEELERDLHGGIHSHHHHHHHPQHQQQKVVLERDLDPPTVTGIRKSAPDVIIMTSSH